MILVFELLRKDSTDFKNFFFVYLVGMRIDRKVFFTPLHPTLIGALKQGF